MEGMGKVALSTCQGWLFYGNFHRKWRLFIDFANKVNVRMMCCKIK